MEAVREGGRILCGGIRKGAMLAATLLENVPENLDLCRKEAFGPVAVLSSFSNFEQALKMVNDSYESLGNPRCRRRRYRGRPLMAC